EGELDREIHAEGVVMDAAALSLTALDPVELVRGPHLSAREPVVGNLRIGHPDREDGTAGDPSLEPRLTPLPASAGVDELAIVDLRALQKERADARPERVLDAEMMEVRVRIVPAVD